MDNTVFLDNKYTRTYIKICEKARSRPKPNGYTEKHHFIPRCMGGSNKKNNLVILTAREHFLVHLLLTKMLSGPQKYKMTRALVRMCGNIEGCNSARYALARRIIAANSRGANNPSFGKQWWHDPNTYERIYIRGDDEVPNGFVRGPGRQLGGFGKGRRWITNGTENRLIHQEENVPEGWRYGSNIKFATSHLGAAAKKRHTPEKDKEHAEKLRGRVAVVKDGKMKRVHKHLLVEMANDGWYPKKKPKGL